MNQENKIRDQEESKFFLMLFGTIVIIGGILSAYYKGYEETKIIGILILIFLFVSPLIVYQKYYISYLAKKKNSLLDACFYWTIGLTGFYIFFNIIILIIYSFLTVRDNTMEHTTLWLSLLGVLVLVISNCDHLFKRNIKTKTKK